MPAAATVTAAATGPLLPEAVRPRPMDRSDVLPILLGALVAGLGAAAFSSVGLGEGYSVVVGLAIGVPILRAETFGGFGTGGAPEPVAALVASLGALVVGTATVALSGGAGLGNTVAIGVGAGGAYAGSYVGDLVCRYV